MKEWATFGRRGRLIALIASITISSQLSYSQQIKDDSAQDVQELSELSLESLMDLDVTSVSKKKEKLQDAPAAIDVLTQDDLQKSGVRSLPEALRLVPGVEVQQLDRNRWAVSIRGFNGAFSDKLLVLLDGRTLYTPLFGGTFWNQQIVPIENIERIEVIRGPGATLWGANAVNGVINIITKSARDTQGGLVKTIYGTHDLETVLRYGFQIGDDAWLRVHGNWFHRDDFADASGNDFHDDWNAVQGGARLDWAVSDVDSLTVIADGFSFQPAARNDQVFSAFVQDEFELIEDRLHLIVGSKFEHNDYSGFEVQPGLRLLWTPSAKTTVWGAVSRAVKVPQRSDQDVTVLSGTTFPPGAPPIVARISATRRARTEEVVAYELGWRFRPEDNLSFQLSLFYNHYEHLTTNEVGTPFLGRGRSEIERSFYISAEYRS